MNKDYIFLVQEKTRLSLFLQKEFPLALGSAVSNSKIRRLIFSGNVSFSRPHSPCFVESKNPSLALERGFRVRACVDAERLFFERQNGDINFELDSSRVVFEDESIIVVNKPAHFPTEETIVQSRDNLHAAVVRYLHKKIGLEKNPPYCGIVHRLDLDTSGLILFSKKRSVNPALHQAFDSSGAEGEGGRSAKKIYLAVCTAAPGAKNSGGLTEGSSFIVENFMGRVSPKSQRAKWGPVPESRGGKYARTDFTVLKRGSVAEIRRFLESAFCAGAEKPLLVQKAPATGGEKPILGRESRAGKPFSSIEAPGPEYFLVQAHILTGRTHQIRVHLSQSGLPVLGDTLYGGREAGRIFLHSYSLSLPHPETGADLHFCANIKDLLCEPPFSQKP